MAAISDTVDRAAKLTSQLLSFARRQALAPEVFAACDAVRSIGDMLDTLSGARIDVIADLPADKCFVSADPSQFDTAVVNMAVNARDAMAGAGQLTIYVRATDSIPPTRAHPSVAGDFVAVSLTDTGVGIAAEKLEKIFEPFFTTKGVGHGTGLGLSQVFGFAKQSGGEVLVDSRVGEGSTFTLYLPRVPAPVGDKEQEAMTEPAPAPTNVRGVRILVVEDNSEVGAFASQALQELGYETTWSPSGEAALEELSTQDGAFDVVFSDVVMPGIGGIELAQMVKKTYPGLPVILTSGYSHVMAQNGTSGFELLHKPYSVEELSRVLTKATRNSRR